MHLPGKLLTFFGLICIQGNGNILPLEKRQHRDFQWGLYGYSEPDCQGELVAAWQGDSRVEMCLPFDGPAQSVAGGSGDGAETAVNLWEDNNCTVAAQIADPTRWDDNQYPCFNGLVQSFTVGAVGESESVK